jgi:hypothetical protein
MKLHIYEQDNSHLRWVRDDEFTPEEQAESRLHKVGEADSAEYEPIGMGFYRRRKGAEG